MKIDEIISYDKQHYVNVFGDRIPIAFEKGEGCILYDTENREYLDFISGISVCNLGHSHPKFVAALKDQIEKLIHTSSLFYIENQTLLAKKLCEISPFDKVFFCNSGAEANEAAIKLVRNYFYKKGSNRYKIITLINSFHGRTLATTAATGQKKYQKPFEPMPEGFLNVEADIEKIRSAIDDKTAAIMIELVQAEGGIKVLEKKFVNEIYKLCKENGILLIIDEVQTGIGRCGSLFCFEQYEVIPDIITLAKGLGNGIPIGAMLCKKEVASFEPGEHGSTFGGNFLATRAALEVLKIIEEENIIDNVKNMGSYLKQKLLELKELFKSIVDVRGLGLLIGVEFSFPVKDMVKELALSGLLTSSCGGGNVVRFAPPLIVQKEHIDKAIEIFKEVVKRYDNMGRA
ncbi:acetylornithine and succinylornithine aminotransferase [Caldicellulosiruptor saccharolyticus DSM 8903]|uniref:Acetylornithine aminotransferase n=1 Tax=Caldicellulosiruptor saccharolyticus (strain ATCC 43494 / DSM 8903 / Tp8T 6331) TaxID=351627 RepID=A4XM22_CALS8|nr:aspartate aminotransferase family protein [Caldicellulosiruptor saccharolyticus]ABP67957.1 acetylornithine and succinylornithine aminotransferase [Caldicellulosiruptor saccharolyticus DSM 8903]